MISDPWAAAVRFGIVLLAFTVAACNSDPQNMAAANGAAVVGGAGNGSAEVNEAGGAEPSAEENEQQAAADAAESAAENATGPVALASDSALPQSCQAHVRAIQACIGRVRDSGQFVEHRERMLRRLLHTSRTETWPAWARADFLERGCSQQTEGIGTTFPEC